MKRKHSPNFIENEREVFEAKNDPVSTFFWTVLFITALMLGFSLVSCKTRKQQSQSILSPIYGTNDSFVGLYSVDSNNVFLEIRPDTTFWYHKGSNKWQISKERAKAFSDSINRIKVLKLLKEATKTI